MCILEPEPEVDDTSMFDYSLLFVAALWDYYVETKDRVRPLKICGKQQKCRLYWHRNRSVMMVW